MDGPTRLIDTSLRSIEIVGREGREKERKKEVERGWSRKRKIEGKWWARKREKSWNASGTFRYARSTNSTKLKKHPRAGRWKKFRFYPAPFFRNEKRSQRKRKRRPYREIRQSRDIEKLTRSSSSISFIESKK